jgi:RNAse (barnase) inhibitor barstar
MGKLLGRMKDASRSGVYRATADPVVLEVAGEAGLEVVAVSLATARDKDSLMKTLAEALGFPKWFGANWDALEDSLSDLSWRDAPGWVLVLRDFDALSRDDLGVLLEVLRSAAQFWAGRGRPFFAVFIDPQRSLALPDLYKEK